jgi:molybdopterin-binding protein
MSLIPGVLPSGACYGTPQELLDLFSQYLTVPAFAVSSKVLYSATSPSPNTDFVWINTAGGDTPLLNLYNDATGGYEPFPFAGGVSSNERLISDKTAITTLANSDLLLVSTLGGGASSSLKKITVANASLKLGKVVQIVEGSTSTAVTVSTLTLTDTGLTVTITPTSASNKILILVSQNYNAYRSSSGQGVKFSVLRGASVIYAGSSTNTDILTSVGNSTTSQLIGMWSFQYLDSPATTSATIYKVQGRPAFNDASGYAAFQSNAERSSIVAIEVTP